MEWCSSYWRSLKAFRPTHLPGNIGAINAVDPTTMGCYMIKYLYEQNKPQEDQTTDEQLIKSGELVVKAEYISLYRKNKLLLEEARN